MKNSFRILTTCCLLSLATPAWAQVIPTPTDTTTSKPTEPTATTPATTTPATTTPATTTSTAVTPAPTQTTQAWWQGLLVIVIEAVVAIVTPILSVLLMILIRKWQLKIEQDKVDWVLDKAIGFAEQTARNALKDGNPLTGPALVTVALTQGRSLLDKYGLAKKFGTWLAEGIEAKLGQSKLEGIKEPKAPAETPADKPA